MKASRAAAMQVAAAEDQAAAVKALESHIKRLEKKIDALIEAQQTAAPAGKEKR